jgi:DNA-binding protein YbaB
MQEVRQQLTHLHATGEAGAGAVRATVDGHKRLLKLEIEDTYMHPEEKETLQDLIIAAITLANNAVEERVQAEIKESASGMLGGLPMDLML